MIRLEQGRRRRTVVLVIGLLFCRDFRNIVLVLLRPTLVVQSTDVGPRKVSTPGLRSKTMCI